MSFSDNILNKNYKSKFILGDTFEEMNKLEDKSVDLILCDLPYGLTANDKDKILPFDEIWKHYKRIISDSGTILLFGQGKFYVSLVNSNIEWFRYDLVWDKVLTSGFLNAKRQPLRSHEQIAVFQKYPSKTTYNPQFTEGKPLHSKGTAYKTKDTVNNNYGKFKQIEGKKTTKKYPKSILQFSKPHPSVALHRTEKSLELLEYLIKTYSNVGDLVLDNTCGSGGVAEACVKLERFFVCIDNDFECIRIAKARVEKIIKM
jgi:DNA (cytosine-5-)-methyltransferase|nr:MAG TPA: adenine-specific methyltransferase [Caudoviricetes sp.]DAS39899.1 MAG TPA: adenine-specific methyltransferase [Caudoviricetes sp.]